MRAVLALACALATLSTAEARKGEKGKTPILGWCAL